MKSQSIAVITLLVCIIICDANSNLCKSKKTCGECIQESKCAWCSEKSWNGTQRCGEDLPNCRKEYLINPINMHEDIENKPLISHKDNMSEVVQIAPQQINLTMRAKKPYNISLKYARAHNPVDLYFLMDLSYSMKDDKETLAKLGKDLEFLMRNFTSDYTLGFGSFVDKTVAPYVNTLPSSLQSPCDGCATPYGFKNHMRLSNEVKNFPLEVERANISANVDDLEGGFDALMQAIVCEDEIGWRKNARHVLVFCTDSGFHIAGDGKLGGIVEPNDGLCHMDKYGMYTHSLLQDYPSVYHLSHKVKEKAINVIFAVTESELEVYKYLAKGIGGAVAGSLQGDSSNILQLVEEQYKKISSMVEMQHDAPDNIAVTFYTSCNRPLHNVKQSNTCGNLKIEEKIEFKVEIKVLECSLNPKEWEQTFKVFPVGSHEALEVQLKLNCDCECEHQGHELYEENSSECSNNGTYNCGTCSCNDLHYGLKCECNYNEGFLPSSGIDNDCKPNKDPKTPECSGHGNCICGACVCNSDDNSDEEFQFYGKYCECNNFSCDRADGTMCAGHGDCKCGKCSCRPEWTGDDCNCEVSKERCKAEGSNEICSDHGECSCGVCECNAEYEGQFCQQIISPLGRQTQCENLFPCVLCLVHKKGPLTAEECSKNCTSIYIEKVDSIGENATGDITCVEYDDDGCRSLYQYYYNDSSVVIVKALKVLECPLQRAAVYLSGIIGSILLAGLVALIIWKIITVHKDRQDFIKFKNERDNAKWNEEGNPLYRQPVTTFTNPAYKALS